MSSTRRGAQEQAIYDSLVYPNSHVLRNKLGIRNQTALDRAEAEAVAFRVATRPVLRKFTLVEMQTVHNTFSAACMHEQVNYAPTLPVAMPPVLQDRNTSNRILNPRFKNP